jgi:hypothetical protein
MGGLFLEHLWSQVRQGLAVLGWVIFVGLVAAAGSWCCGYVARSDLLRTRPPVRRQRRAGPAVRLRLDDGGSRWDDAEINDEAARGIRDIERYLSTV